MGPREGELLTRTDKFRVVLTTYLQVRVAKDDGTTEMVVDEAKMVKRFARSAAGTDAQTATDLRPPAVLLKTTDYLFNELLSDEDSLARCNGFIWDRTRAIRNDFSIQQVKKITDIRLAIEVFEKIARYHILSLHQIGTKDKEVAGDSYDWQQDREQLDKTLLSLLTYYDKVQKRYRSDNEAEFRAYWIIFQIGNITTNVEDKVQSWPRDLLSKKRIIRALDIYAAASDIMSHKGPLPPLALLPIAQQNWQKFWNLVGSKQTSYLLACVAEIGFNLVRRVVLTSLCMTFRQGKKDVQDWTLDKLAEILGFDDEDTTRDYLEKHNLTFGQTADGVEYLQLTVRTVLGLPDAQPDLPRQTQSWHLVERKRFGRSWSAVIAGMSFRTAKENGMLSPDWMEDARARSSQDEGLFVEDEKRPGSASSQAAAPVNPFATAVAPSTAAAETKPPAFNPFAQAIQTQVSPFGQPAAAASPFGLPSTTASASSSATPAATASTTGTFGPLPGAFSFSNTPPSAPASATTAPSTVTPPNPFASFAPSVKEPAPPAQESKIAAASSPFSFTPQSSISGTSSSAANPFAGLGNNVLGVKKTEVAASTAPAAALTTTALPSFQISPPQTDAAGKAKATDQEAAPKPTFQYPSSSGGSNFGPKPTESQPALAATSSPFNFHTTSTTASTANPANSQGAAGPSKSAQPFSPPVSSGLPAAPTTSFPSNLPALPQSNRLGPALPAFAPPAREPVPSAPAQFMPPVQPPPKKSVSFAPQPNTTPRAAPPTTTTSLLDTWKATRGRQGMDYLADRVLIDPDHGLIMEYIAHIARPMIQKELRNEAQRQAKLEKARVRNKYLSTKYGRLWRYLAIMMKSRRKRREMKQRAAEARQKKLAASQQKKAASPEEIELSIEEQHALYKAREEQRLKEAQEKAWAEREKLRASLGGPMLAFPPAASNNNSFDLIGQRRDEPAAASGSNRGHQRSQTQPNVLAPRTGLGRITKPSRDASPALSNASSRSSMRASLINGGSLADSGLPYGKKASTMQSPYFRLKAAGFASTLKNSFSSITSGVKRPRLSGDDILAGGLIHGSASEAPATKRLRSPADVPPFSSPARPAPSNLAASFGSSTSSNGAYKRSAEDEDLLARARRLRETLEESENWFKDEIQKEEFRRSQELWRSQLGSRPASQAGSPTTGPNGEDLSRLPKFYSRVSKFVPREEYGVRKERKPVQEELKGKEKVNGNGMSSGNSGGRGGSGRQMPPPPAPPKPAPAAKQAGTSWDDAIEL